MASIKFCHCVRTQLIVSGCCYLDMSGKNCTFAIAKGFKIKSNNSKHNNSNIIINNNIIINIITMEIINSMIQTTLESFDFAYCLVINVLTYLIINIINSRNGNIDMKTWSKRLVLFICIIIVGTIYYFNGSNTKVIINSSIITPVFWSWIMKPICKKFKIDYKQLNLFE